MNGSLHTAVPHTLPTPASGLPLWSAQVAAIFRIEIFKAMFSKRALSCYGLATMPMTIFLIAAYESWYHDEPAFQNIEEARRVFGYVFSTLILGAVIYLGNAAIFTTLFRGEILDRSFHYYLLTPVRREVLLAGKFLAGLAAAVLIFSISTLVCMLLSYTQFGTEYLLTDITSGIFFEQLGLYLGITVLACLGYGSVFMAAGLLFKNPLIPVVIIAGWELIHFIVPPALKVFSIVYYLKGLLPIPLDEGPLAVIVAPPPVWVSVFGMFALCLAMLACSAWLLKNLEIRYTDE